MTDDERNTMPDHKPTLGEMSHANPYTGRVFGETRTYSRGKTVAADGGETNAVADLEDDEETLADVDHTPTADEVDGTQGSFDRGNERADGADHE